MKKPVFIIASLFILSFLAVACSSIYYTGVWKDEQKLGTKSYQSVFVSALVDNIITKQAVESDLATVLEAKGFKVIKASDHFKPNYFADNADNEELILGKVKEFGCDGILTVALVDKQSDTRYVEGTAGYTPYPTFGYFGRFGRYYRVRYPMVYEPGYYETDKTYYFENNFYDAGSGDILFSMQSEVVNPDKLSEFSKAYAAELVVQLQKEGIIAK